MAFLRERSGRWSPVKIAAFGGAVLPALWISWQALAGDLGARPVTEAIHQTGDWALRLLLITLAVSPAQRILNFPRIGLARRTLGVATAAYALCHLTLYMADQHFDLLKVATEIVVRIYLLIGLIGLIGLIALASTSLDRAIRALGPERWNALHRIVYAIALLAMVHYFLQTKLEIYQPVIMAGFLLWLLAYRVLSRGRGALSTLQLLVLTLVVAIVAALGEATIYMIASGVDAKLVLLAHFDLEMEVRPAWWVLATGLFVTGLGFWRQKPVRQRPSARRMSSTAFSGATQVQSGS
ncbi:MAG: sulfite oxidase heme-binding subunit YedZ [Xanthobacteraceae bacterium]